MRASDEAREHIGDTNATETALKRAQLLWGKTELSEKFSKLLRSRGVSIYNSSLEHHFTGSAIVLNTRTNKILMTYHPWYQMWLQLGGHDEGEHDPLAVSAREAWEESGIEDLWMFDWPVRVDPHSAKKCRSVKGDHHNWHYDICYMSVTDETGYKISDESIDMSWFSLAELQQMVVDGKAQLRAYKMAANSIALLAALSGVGNLPPIS